MVLNFGTRPAISGEGKKRLYQTQYSIDTYFIWSQKNERTSRLRTQRQTECAKHFAWGANDSTNLLS